MLLAATTHSILHSIWLWSIDIQKKKFNRCFACANVFMAVNKQTPFPRSFPARMHYIHPNDTFQRVQLCFMFQLIHHFSRNLKNKIKTDSELNRMQPEEIVREVLSKIHEQ